MLVHKKGNKMQMHKGIILMKNEKRLKKKQPMKIIMKDLKNNSDVFNNCTYSFFCKFETLCT